MAVDVVAEAAEEAPDEEEEVGEEETVGTTTAATLLQTTNLSHIEQVEVNSIHRHSNAAHQVSFLQTQRFHLLLGSDHHHHLQTWAAHHQLKGFWDMVNRSISTTQDRHRCSSSLQFTTIHTEMLLHRAGFHHHLPLHSS